jgi:predicted enzyme related to lactoylglutathione lyase
VAGAAAFYREVVGWETQEASTAKLAYIRFTAGKVPVAGLMELPEEGRRRGASPRWMGYIGVSDVHSTVERIKRLGGAVYVPPTDSNIGLISVVTDPIALVDYTRAKPQPPAEFGKTGRVGWHELFAADLEKEPAFYCELLGWQRSDDNANPADGYQLFFTGGIVIGAAFSKHPNEPVPFWLLHFNVDDLDAAAERVRAAGGKAFRSKDELPGRFSVAHCIDAQGASFALRGKQSRARKLGWSTEWQGFSSQGQLLTPKSPPDSDK